MNDAPTFRCGWRYYRPTDAELRRFAIEAPPVVIRRGQWQLTLQAAIFDAMPDESFADYVSRCYRDTAFEQMEADLDVLARHVVDVMGLGDEAFCTEAPAGDVKAALHRWQKTQRDMQDVVM